MKMTKLAAKRAALAMWRWLRDNPGKGKLDYAEVNPAIKTWQAGCPLCELSNFNSCMAGTCPLAVHHCNDYYAWKSEKTAENADVVVKLIEAWKI